MSRRAILVGAFVAAWALAVILSRLGSAAAAPRPVGGVPVAQCRGAGALQPEPACRRAWDEARRRFLAPRVAQP